MTVGISAMLAWLEIKTYDLLRSICSSPFTLTLILNVHKMHFDHAQGHQRKKFPFLSNGIDPNAKRESTNEIGKRKINEPQKTRT